MSEYDGEIRIKAVVDSTSIEKDLTKQKNAYKELSKEREQLLKSQSKYEKQSSKLIRQQDALNERLKTQENRYEKIKDKLDLFKSSTDFSAMNIYSKEEEARIKHFEMDLGLIADKIKKLKGEIENTNQASTETTKELKNISDALELNYSNIDKSKKLIESLEIASKLKRIQEILEKIKADTLASKLKNLKSIIDNIKAELFAEKLKKIQKANEEIRLEKTKEKIAELISVLAKIKSNKLENKLKNLKNMVDSIKTEKLEGEFKRLQNAISTGKSQKDLSDVGKGIKNLENTVGNIKSENLKEVSKALENLKTKYSEENVNRLQKAIENVKPDNLEEIKKALDGVKTKNLEEIKKALEDIKTKNSEENIKKLQEAIENAKPDNLEEIKKALDGVKTKNSEENIKKLQEAINNIKPNNLEENINRLQESINNIKTTQFDGRIKNLKDGLKELDARLKYGSYALDALKAGFEKISGPIGKLGNIVKSSLVGLGNALKADLINTVKNASTSFSGFGSRISDGMKNAGKAVGGFSNRVLNLAKAAFVFNILRSGLNELSKGLMALIKSDSSLSSSLQEIKANLLTAFAPIYNAILPALRELGKFLSWASLQLATFMSALFGKTLSQSQQSAYDMSKAISSSNSSLKKQSKGLNSVSKSSKKAKNSLASFDKTASKTAKNALASFDKIEVLKKDKGPKTPENKNENNQVSVGINKESFKKVDDEISSFWNGIAERLKAPFQDIDLSNLIDSFERLKGTLSEFGQGTADGLWWIYENILAPFAKWTISEALPRFLDVFNAALKVIQPIAGQVGKDLKFIYDGFLKPAAEWAGAKINEFLDNLKDGLENLANWLADGDNKPMLEFISKFLIGISAAAVTVGLGKLAVVISTKLVTALLSMNAALLANPWTPVVIGIGLVIAAIIGISEHWDEMKDYFNDAWENAKNIIKGMKQMFNGLKTFFGGWIDFLGGLFSGDWNRMWKGAINIVIGILNTLIGVLNTIGNTINSVINFIIGGINYGIDSINKIGFKLPDWLGGHEFKLNIPKVHTIPTENKLIPEIPKLAQGAVLDGSSPFLAWLNDQPKGQTNIETPLNTMVEAFNKAIDNRGMNNNVVIQASGDISQLISYLHFELKKENSRIGDNMISGSVYV